MTGLFIGRGPVVQVKQGWGAVDSKESTMRKPLYDGPLLVRCGAVRCGAVRCGAVRMIFFKNRTVRCGAVIR